MKKDSHGRFVKGASGNPSGRSRDVSCKKCGGIERTASRNCVACRKTYISAWNKANAEKLKKRKAELYIANKDQVKARSAAWYAANPEKAKAYKEAWNKENREKVNAYSVAWKAANPEKRKKAVAKWAAAHPETSRIRNHNRRARKAKSEGRLSRGLTKKLFKLQKGKCACCGLPLSDDYHLDHRMPLVLGGAHEDSNMQLLRKLCNLQKSARHPIDFMQSRGFLL